MNEQEILIPPPLKRESKGNGLATPAFLVIILWGLAVAKDFLIPLCIAGLLAFLILPVIRVLRKQRVPEWIAVLLGTLLLLLPFLITAYVLVRQGQSLMHDFPRISKTLQGLVEQFTRSDFAHRFHLEDSISLNALAEKLGSSATESAAVVVAGLRTILETGSNLVLVFIFTLLMILMRKHLRLSTEKILSRFETIHSANMLDAVTSLIEQFLLARLVIVVLVTLLSSILMVSFRVPYGFLLSVMVGVLTIIPEVGFFISLVPVIVVSAATGHSFWAVFAIASIQIVIHLVEANVISPKLVGDKLNINVLAGFIGLFGGGLLWGVWGMLLSVPILGVLRIVFSATPSLQPWGDLLSEREDDALLRQIVRGSRLPQFFKGQRTADTH